MSDWYNYSWMDAVEKLDSDEKVGLDSVKVKEMQEKYGRNIIFKIEEKKKFSIVKEMILVPWFLLLILASFLMFLSGNYISGVIFFILTISSDLLFYYDELQKNKNVKQLEKIDKVNTSVLRDGRIFMIPAEELVVGDIVLLQKGSTVPADLRIIECKNLKAKQNSVTGENYEAEKYETKIEENDISLVEMKNMLFKSSIITDGIGGGIVTAVGSDTEVGKIVKILCEDKKRKRIFEGLVKKSIIILEIVTIASLLMMVGINFIYGIKYKSIISKIALVLSSFLPVALIMIVSAYFQCVKKYFKNNGIEIKNLSSIEVASTIDMVWVHKLGFLSENEMTAVKLYSDEAIVDLSTEDLEISKNIERIIHISLLCNNNSKNNVEEKALIEFGKKHTYNKSNLDSKFRRMFEIPFDLEKGIKTTVNKIEKKYRANVVGAVDKMLEACKFIMKDGVEAEITDEDIEKIKSADIDMSTECLNVTGFAYRNFKYAPSKDEKIESYLVFVGLIGFINPMKIEEVEALRESENSGITTIITSEDSKLTAISVGSNLGFELSLENVLCGVEIENMDEAALTTHIDKVKMLSRLTVSDKMRVLNTFKTKSHNILVTGTNLTDLPLLEAGDISLAFSETCSSTLKATADTYIQEANYNKIVLYIEESKRIYSKFAKFLKYAFSICFAEGIFMLLFCSLNNLDLSDAFLVQETNIIFILLSCVYFSLRDGHKGFYEASENKINYWTIIKSGVFTGTFSFIILFVTNFLDLNDNYFVNLALTIAVLPIMELIFLNRKFNTW